jgi:hypothetical protein
MIKNMLQKFIDSDPEETVLIGLLFLLSIIVVPLFLLIFLPIYLFGLIAKPIFNKIYKVDPAGNRGHGPGK